MYLDPSSEHINMTILVSLGITPGSCTPHHKIFVHRHAPWLAPSLSHAPFLVLFTSRHRNDTAAAPVCFSRCIVGFAFSSLRRDVKHFDVRRRNVVRRCVVRRCVVRRSWLGIPILDSVPWDGRNSEFRFRVPEPRTFRRKLKSENLKTPLVENRNSGSYFSGIPEFRL
jgi:hypothetical protein